jgi:hypothetical protein
VQVVEDGRGGGGVDPCQRRVRRGEGARRRDVSVDRDGLDIGNDHPPGRADSRVPEPLIGKGRLPAGRTSRPDDDLVGLGTAGVEGVLALHVALVVELLPVEHLDPVARLPVELEADPSGGDLTEVVDGGAVGQLPALDDGERSMPADRRDRRGFKMSGRP